MYCVWQLEEGEEGTRHLQGYVLFSNAVRFSTVKKYNNTAHWEIRRGTHDQAKTYCTKSDTRVEGPFEFGKEPRGQGSRTDLAAIKERVDRGDVEADLWEADFSSMVKYTRGIREYIQLKCKPRTWKTTVDVLWGPTGCGKSHAAREEAGDGAYWKIRGNNEWWDGYLGQPNVVIDEFYGWLRWDSLLRLLDQYPLRLEIKGGSQQFVARRIWITSNAPPSEWYEYGPKMQYRTLERRLTTVRTRDAQSDAWRYEKGEPDLERVGLILRETEMGYPGIRRSQTLVKARELTDSEEELEAAADLEEYEISRASTYRPTVIEIPE